ncbi:MAG: EAL domain-containing protein [Clostridiales bacterium]|nr:EAL domain-containing protein [Clostridiales bacterium]
MKEGTKSNHYAGMELDKELVKLNPLTGLLYNRAFFKQADECLKRIEPDTYSLVAIDIEHFRLFNKLYGREEGDNLLIYVADCVRQLAEEHDGAARYLGGDNFCVLIPDREELLEQLKSNISKGVKRLSNTVGFLPALGVFGITDPAMPAMQMYDRATIALSHVLGNYMQRICRYDSSMVDKLEEEILLLSEIQIALEKDEFTFFVQPQCDIFTGKIVGAESLVRWKHPTKGMVPPGLFIPVLEKNGFIADLDRYVWKKVCEWLRDWMDRGYQPVPISINVSRIDIFSMDVPAYLQELIETYGLEPNHIKVELTESAYAENNDKIIHTVKRLQESGFLVMMDDFGSGYSSLNMLKSVAVDVLKIDMRFLDINEKEEEKGIGILESVVNMSRQMGLPIIVEGVETKKQEDFLVGMGCRYTQGYYYYKPLPIAEFEKLLSDETMLDLNGLLCKQVEALHIREFLDSNLFSDTMVNNILGAAAFYDIYENKVEIVRVNDQYYQLTGIDASDKEKVGQRLWDYVQGEDRQAMLSIFDEAYENRVNGAQGYIHFRRTDGEMLWVYLRVFFLREREGHKIFYSSLIDMTAMQEEKRRIMSEQEVSELSEKQREHMGKYYGDMPCGYSVGKILLDENGKVSRYEIVYANHEMEHVCGGNVKRLKHLFQKAFENDHEEILEKAYRAAYLGEQADYYVYSSVSSRYLQITFYQYEYGYVGCILRDVTYSHIYEDALKSVMMSYRAVYFVHLDDNYYRMIYPDENHLLDHGNYEEAIKRHFELGVIREQDEENIRDILSLKELRSALEKKDAVEYKYRRRTSNGEEEWCLTTFTVDEREAGHPKTAIMTIRSIDTFIKAEECRRREQLAETLGSMSEGFMIYRSAEDEKILYVNPPVLRMFGCDSVKEFRKLVGGSFRGMVHPEDIKRVEREIKEQVEATDKKMDYIRYRIARKDGEIRWIDDCGHLEESEPDGNLFYVLLSDITDTITEKQKNEILNENRKIQGE